MLLWEAEPNITTPGIMAVCLCKENLIGTSGPFIQNSIVICSKTEGGFLFIQYMLHWQTRSSITASNWLPSTYCWVKFRCFKDWWKSTQTHPIVMESALWNMRWISDKNAVTTAEACCNVIQLFCLAFFYFQGLDFTDEYLSETWFRRRLPCRIFCCQHFCKRRLHTVEKMSYCSV